MPFDFTTELPLRTTVNDVALTDVTSLGLVAEGFDHMGVRTNKGNAVFGALLGKSCVLTQEAVSGVDHGDIVQFGDADDFVLGEVCANGSELCRISDLVCLVSLREVKKGMGLRV